MTHVYGQGGANLSELLLYKCCEVHGIKRCSSLFSIEPSTPS